MGDDFWCRVGSWQAETWETDKRAEEDSGDEELLESLTEEEKRLLQDLDSAEERDGDGSPGPSGGPPTPGNSYEELEDDDGFLDDLDEDKDEEEEVQIEELSPVRAPGPVMHSTPCPSGLTVVSHLSRRSLPCQFLHGMSVRPDCC